VGHSQKPTYWQNCKNKPVEAGKKKSKLGSTARKNFRLKLCSHRMVCLFTKMAQRLGLRVAEAQGVVQIKAVLRGGAAEKAGMAAGDEWWAVASSKVRSTTWRLKKLDELALLLGSDIKAKATITRDQKVFVLDLSIPSDVHTWRLSYTNSDHVHKARTSSWLDGTSSTA
jgi:predicted metalloprotease with PDZ domain